MEQEKKTLQIIVAGLPRTGTLSIKNALEELGYGPCHHLLEPSCQISRLRQSATIIGMEPGERRQSALRRLFEGYEVCLDVPGSACVDELRTLYPEAKVILSTRQNGHVWMDSYDSIFNPTTSLSFRYVGYLVPGVYSCSRMVMNWRILYEARFPGTKIPSPEMYEKHSSFIRDLTPASHFLEFQIGSGWEPLCKFLGKPIPDKLFPRTNERRYLATVNTLAYASGLISWMAVLSASTYLPHIFSVLLENECIRTLLISQLVLLFASLCLRSHILRGVVLSIVGCFLCMLVVDESAKSLTENGITNSVVFSSMSLQLVRASDILFFAPLNNPPKDIIEAFNFLWNMREVGSRTQIRNISESWNRTNYQQTRSSFFVKHLLTFVLSYALLEIVLIAPAAPPTDSFIQAILVSVLSTAAFWLTLSAYLSLIYDAIAILQVALFISEPSDWPPLFGSALEACSIRQFWGVTWHQTLRRPFGSHAERIIQFLGISTHQKIRRYAKLLIVFSLSGAMHWIADFIIHVPWSESGSMQFFILQALGIMGEEFVQSWNQYVGLVLSQKTKRFCGYMWLSIWLFVTTPGWMDRTAAHIRPGKDSLLPIQVFESVSKTGGR